MESFCRDNGAEAAGERDTGCVNKPGLCVDISVSGGVNGLHAPPVTVSIPQL